MDVGIFLDFQATIPLVGETHLLTELPKEGLGRLLLRTEVVSVTVPGGPLYRTGDLL